MSVIRLIYENDVICPIIYDKILTCGCKTTNENLVDNYNMEWISMPWYYHSSIIIVNLLQLT